jgi:hypothetical protein
VRRMQAFIDREEIVIVEIIENCTSVKNSLCCYFPDVCNYAHKNTMCQTLDSLCSASSKKKDLNS